jgi:hypothetical protein
VERTTEKHALRAGAVGVWTIALGAGALLAVTLGGCGAPMERASGRGGWGGGGGNQAEDWEGAAGSWALVMQSPRTTQLLAGADPRSADEYSRNDAALGAGRDGPILATSEWPERERPDLYYARRIQLETRADELLYFDRESRYRGGYRYGTYGGNVSGSGTWGFWR